MEWSWRECADVAEIQTKEGESEGGERDQHWGYT